MADEIANEDGPEQEKPPSEEVVAARIALEPFLSENKSASVRDQDDLPWVLTPWGDESLSIMIPQDPTELFETLNSLVLPDRFSAIWHRDTQDFEVIWTASKLLSSQKEIYGRKFEFNFRETIYKCEFGRSSARLLSLAKHVIPISMSQTNWRNLVSFGRYATIDENDPPEESNDLDEPKSFWVRSVNLNQDDAIELVRNLNFFLTYYDNRSPYINIHDVDPEIESQPRVRYVAGKFPEKIASRPLDNILLNFWTAAVGGGDVALRFLYYYRIIEYASSFYVESSARKAVRKVLAAPDAADNVASVTDKVIAALNESKLDEYNQFLQLVKDTVDVRILWQEMGQNNDAFCQDVTFDGGFTLGALVGKGCTEELFIPKGIESFVKSVRDIRNALAHGREKKSTSVITATVRNLNLLRPWVNLIAFAAGEVVLYKDIP